MATEKVFCPHCSKSDVKTFAVMDSEPETEAAVLLTSGKPNYGTFGVRRRRRLYEQYFPVCHHCKNCGHTFLSLETNEQELQRSILNRNCAIWATILWSVVGFLLIISGGTLGEIAGILFGVCALVIAVLGVVNTVNSIKAIQNLRQQLDELQNTQQS